MKLSCCYRAKFKKSTAKFSFTITWNFSVGYYLNVVHCDILRHTAALVLTIQLSSETHFLKHETRAANTPCDK